MLFIKWFVSHETVAFGGFTKHLKPCIQFTYNESNDIRTTTIRCNERVHIRPTKYLDFFLLILSLEIKIVFISFASDFQLSKIFEFTPFHCHGWCFQCLCLISQCVLLYVCVASSYFPSKAKEKKRNKLIAYNCHCSISN